MKTSSYQTPNIHRATRNADLPEIIREIERAITDGAEFYDRNEHALNTRFCFWEGQDRDGRKHSTDSRAAFPWENASDVRIRMCDMVIDEHVDLYLAALQRMTVQVIPTKARDADYASRISSLLRWYLMNEMADEGDSEIELLANYMETYGSAVLSIHWLQQLAYELKEVRLEQMAEAALKLGGPKMLYDIAQLLRDPLQRPVAVQYVKQFSEFLTTREAEKVLRDLVQVGVASFPAPRLAESRPGIAALQVFQDVYFPVNTSRLQRARWIAQRELLTETELLEKAEGREGWDEDFVKHVQETAKGKMWNGNLSALNVFERQREIGGVWGAIEDEAAEMYEVWHFYHRASTRGIPGLYRTVLHPHCREYTGLHELCPYAHGEYPHVEFVRERKARSILASRGLPELLDTPQSEVKVQRDSRIDRTSITVTPPMKVKALRGRGPIAYGPRVEIPVTKMDEMEPLLMGPPDATSIEVEKSTKMDVNEFVGRPGEGVDPQLVIDKRQARVNRWLKRWRMASKQILQLAQQYTPEMTVGRVAGLIANPFDISRDAIARQFDLIVSYDARYGSPEFVFELLKNLNQYLVTLDTNAVINRDEVIRYAMASLDPTLADLAVRDSENASQ
jgi:hypothetical protein